MASSESHSASSTQYNEIADVYSALYPPGGDTNMDFPVAAIEAHQLYLTVTDPAIDIRGKKVLDLACGNGHNSCKFLSWGAESVTGLDISDSMLEVGRADARRQNIPASKLRYVLGDASDEDLVVQGAPFDMVTGCWLLNYAHDASSMTKFWRFIGKNLKPGGHWVGLTIPPLVSGQPWAGQMLDYFMSPSGPWERCGNGGKVLATLPNGDGFKCRVDLYLPGKPKDVASFDNYYLTLDIFERSCADSGCFERPVWRAFRVPDELSGLKLAGFWNDLILQPHCRVLTAKRKD